MPWSDDRVLQAASVYCKIYQRAGQLRRVDGTDLDIVVPGTLICQCEASLADISLCIIIKSKTALYRTAQPALLHRCNHSGLIRIRYLIH